MLYNATIEKKYKTNFKVKEIKKEKFDENIFFNIIDNGLDIIIESLEQKKFPIILDKIIEYCFFDKALWTKLKNAVKKYRNDKGLVIDNQKDALECILEELYQYNLETLKINSSTSLDQLKNFFFYFVMGLFSYKSSESLLKSFKKYNVIDKLKNIDELLLDYKKNNDQNYFVLITLLCWSANSINDLLNDKKYLKLKSQALLNQEVKQHQQQLGANDDLQEQAEIIPLKLTYDKLKKLNDHFKERIIGQDQVIEKLNEILISQMYNVSKKNHRPIGVLFFVGPTGVGKTETVKELAKFLYDSEQIHRFDMSEYKSEVAIQKLIGAPNGYVGYQEGGTLTNAMIKNPNTIVLFDEIEKADKSVFDLFLQMIDEGTVTSNKGVKCYFDNTIIVFTSNLGVSNITARMGFENIESIIKENVEYFFNHTINRPELLGRIGNENIVVFDLIHKQEDLFKILDIQFKSFIDEYKELNIKFDYQREELYKAILSSIDLSKGARDIRNKFESFKKHLYHAFFKKELSIDDMKDKEIKFDYDGKVVNITEVKEIKK